MQSKIILHLVVAVSAMLAGAHALAHHGAAAYTDQIVTLQASVSEFRFINPHVQVYFDVKNQQGEVEHWQGELTAPNTLARAGWSKTTMNPGDEFSISGRAGKNGGRSLWITAIVTASGESLPTRESVD